MVYLWNCWDNFCIDLLLMVDISELCAFRNELKGWKRFACLISSMLSFRIFLRKLWSFCSLANINLCFCICSFSFRSLFLQNDSSCSYACGLRLAGLFGEKATWSRVLEMGARAVFILVKVVLARSSLEFLLTGLLPGEGLRCLPTTLALRPVCWSFKADSYYFNRRSSRTRRYLSSAWEPFYTLRAACFVFSFWFFRSNLSANAVASWTWATSFAHLPL